MNISTKILEARKAKGLTQKQLSEIIGVHVVYIGFIENGKRTPSMKILSKICDALGLELNIK